MTEGCTNKSVGTIVRNDGKILLIERKNMPYGFACPAGHVDPREDFEACAKRELFEETGLTAIKVKFLIEGRQEGICRRGGTFHDWKVYEVEVQGDIKPSEREMKQIGWYSLDKIHKLGEKTKKYVARQISETNWQKSPGLEMAWFNWFSKLGII